MVDNLGLTLTPDSMVSFRDATWPMLLMSFLAFAGNAFYPCFLRLLIWTIYKVSPTISSLKESTRFLLDHPRRCYTLLFPSTATWILAAILVALNFLDTILVICLDLDNPEVNVLPMGSRVAAAIFQAASASHTGTASFSLANVDPAVWYIFLGVFCICCSESKKITDRQDYVSIYIYIYIYIPILCYLRHYI
jgi:Trk-type K+ transport system membrane component